MSTIEYAASEEGGEGEASEHIKGEPVVNCLNWFEIGSFGTGGEVQGARTLAFTIGTIADGQSIMLMVVVTIVSLLVHIYSSEYVKGDRRYVHYYAFLSLFTASMLFMGLATSTLQLIVGWELVGVCSFALIGHWWEDQPNSDAALKAFLTNRVGDIGLLIGMIVLFFGAGQSFDILTINHAAVSGDMSQTSMTVASLCLLTAVMSKSGQFILHTWLPDAMAGPTPVSASDPRRHDGRRRYLHGRPPLPGLLGGHEHPRLELQRSGLRRRTHHRRWWSPCLRPA